jgi:hypothetical protein
MQDCNTREHCAMASPSPQDIRRASRNASIRDLESRQGVRLDGSTVSAESPLHLRLPQPQNVLLGNRQMHHSEDRSTRPRASTCVSRRNQGNAKELPEEDSKVTPIPSLDPLRQAAECGDI